MRVYGRNVFKELKSNPEQIKKVYLSKNNDDETFDFIKEHKIFYEIMDNSRLDKLVSGRHQGIVMEINDFEYKELNDLYQYNSLIILDHLNDPHNFGAIIRTCEALGVKGIIIPKNRSVAVNDTVIKVSAGAINYVDICMVNNLVQTINKLKEKNYFIYGTDMEGKTYYDISYAPKKVIVVGNEGEGISRLVSECCDEMIKIPMAGKINSLNASVATAIVISEIVR